MYRTWAVARHMIAESIRRKIALVGFVLIGVILAIMPLVVEGDGATLTSRVQLYLALTLWLVGLILKVVTGLLACNAISDEVVQKRIFMVVTKPLPRWQLLLGKWLGIGVLNAMLLVACLLSFLVATRYLRGVNTTIGGDAKRLQFEVLSARYGVQPRQPDFAADIEEHVRRLREEGRLDQVNEDALNEIRIQRSEQLKTAWRAIGPGQVKRYEFKCPMVDRSDKGFVHVRFKPTHAGGMTGVEFPVTIQCGDLDEPQTLTGQYSAKYPVDVFSTVPVPAAAVNSKGILYVMMRNEDPQYTYNFDGNDAMEVMYDLGTFHWNLFRALSILWCQLAFLAAFGLMMSSWLSFPVACMGTVAVAITASSASFLGTALSWTTPMDSATAHDPLGPIGPMVRNTLQAFIWLVPDFSKYDPDDNIVNGRLVTLMWVIHAIIDLVLIKGAVVLALGCLILSRRELAKETA